jgi:hypothetical protein
MTKITYNIHYANGKTKVTITPPGAKFNPGAEVRFKSDYKGTVAIRYPKSSPFKELATREVKTLPTGPLTLKAIKTVHHFECGEINDTIPSGGKGHGKVRFTAWKGSGGNTPSGH